MVQLLLEKTRNAIKKSNIIEKSSSLEQNNITPAQFNTISDVKKKGRKYYNFHKRMNSKTIENSKENSEDEKHGDNYETNQEVAVINELRSKTASSQYDEDMERNNNFETSNVKGGFHENIYESPKMTVKSSKRILIKKDQQSYTIEEQPNREWK